MPLEWLSSDLETLRTDNPDELEHPATTSVILAADEMAAGFLPCPGGINDQPAKLMAGIRIWRDMMRKAESEYHKRRAG